MSKFVRLNPFHARTVVQEQSAASSLEVFESKYARVEDIWMGVEWVLARSPERGEKIGDYYLMKSPDWDIEDTPQITVLYDFDEDSVTVYAVRDATDDKPDDQA